MSEAQRARIYIEAMAETAWQCRNPHKAALFSLIRGGKLGPNDPVFIDAWHAYYTAWNQVRHMEAMAYQRGLELCVEWSPAVKAMVGAKIRHGAI